MWKVLKIFISVASSSKVVKYIINLFLPKDKKFFQIIWWNIRLMFIFVIFRDFFVFVFKTYLYFVNMFYENILFVLDNYVSKFSRNLSWFFYYIFMCIYKVVSFKLFKDIFIFFRQIVREKQSYDSYYWIIIDLWREFVLKVLDFILYLLKLNYFIYFYKFYKFFIVELIIGGFWGFLIWFFRFRLIGRYFRTNWVRFWYHCKLMVVIRFIQQNLRGFFYINELEPILWWGFDDEKEASFKEVLRGTELDMEAEKVNVFHWFTQRFIWFYFFRHISFFHYFLLFFYLLFAFFFLILKMFYNLFKIFYIKYFNRTFKFRYLFKKCSI